MVSLSTQIAWPPDKGAYDYISTLNASELAWEFLRRNSRYESDFASQTASVVPPKTLPSGQMVWQKPAASPSAAHWGLASFVDPSLSALEAPIQWLPGTGVAVLSATAVRASSHEEADLDLPTLRGNGHIVLDDSGPQHVILNSTDTAIVLHVQGDRIVDGPVDLTFHVPGVAFAARAGAWLTKLPRLLSKPPRWICDTPRRTQLRNALIALDGNRAGASYREVADFVFGKARSSAGWSKSNRALKDQVIRSVRRGRDLARGGYLRLIS